MSETGRLKRLEATMREAGAQPDPRLSGSSHRKWRFPDGYFIQLPADAHRGIRWANVETTMRRAIRDHGVSLMPATSPGMRPNEVDDWAPHPASPADFAPVVPPYNQPTAEVVMAAPETIRHQCIHCAFNTADMRGFVAHQRSHEPRKACPDCGREFGNVEKHRNVAHREPRSVKARRLEPLLRGAASPEPGTITVDALLGQLRGLIIHLEEENKLLRRDMAKANEQLEKVRNFVGSRS